MIIQQSKTNKISLMIRIITISVIICSLWIIFTHKNYYRMSLAELTKYARKNDPKAQTALGCRYDKGVGVAEDPKTAFNLYQKAAKQGNTAAMYKIAYLYAEGRGVEQSFDKAREWYQKMLELEPDSSDAVYGVCWSYIKQESYANAMPFCKQAVDKGAVEGESAVAWLLEKGVEGQEGKAQAMELYSNAAEKGSSSAMLNLAAAYVTGDGVKKDVAKGLELYRKAAEAGEAAAQGYLGHVYIIGAVGGYVVGRDYKKALAYIEQGIEKQDMQAQYLMGWLHHSGRGRPRDFKQAMEWYQKAAAQNMPNAINNIGYMYEHGQGVATDRNEAIKWYKRAAALNYKEAKRNLERLGQQ